MSPDGIISVIQESLYWIIVFGVFIGYALFRGKQSLVNLILGLYFALLISLEFPYYDFLFGRINSTHLTDSVLMVVVFVFFTILATFLFGKLMPQPYEEGAFEAFPKKLLLALLASVLVMAYSYHVLPITELITPGSPIQTIFGPESRFFWWLLIPMIGLFFL